MLIKEKRLYKNYKVSFAKEGIMFKRLWLSMLMAVILLLVPAGFVLADDGSMNVVVNNRTITVSGVINDKVSNDTFAMLNYGLTMQLLDEHKTKSFRLSQVTAKLADKKWSFSFAPFNVPREMPTGTYIIRVSGKAVTPFESSFSYINIYEKIDALNAVDRAHGLAIKDKLILNEQVSPLMLSDYLSLSEPWMNKVNDVIDALDLSVVAEGDNLVAKIDILKLNLEKNVQAAMLCSASNTTDFMTLVQNKSNQLGLDVLYYNQLSDKTKISELFMNYDFDTLTGIDFSKLNNIFDESVLLSSVEDLDYGLTNEILKYYQAKNIITIDYSNFNLLNGGNKILALKEIRSSGFTTIPTLKQNYEAIAKKYYDAQVLNEIKPPVVTGGSGGRTVIKGNAVPQTQPQIPVIVEPKPTLLDVNEIPWAKDGIEYLYKKGFIQGKGDNKFYPNDMVTREEFIKIIVSTFGLNDNTASVNFEDVKKDDWYYASIASAKKAGVISGVSDITFGVGQVITRQDMAVIIARLYTKLGINKTSTTIKEFKDENQISEYAKEAIAKLSSTGIIDGTGDGNFSPKEAVTRGQTAKIAYELVKIIGGQ